MKKIVFIFLIAALAGCKKQEDNKEDNLIKVTCENCDLTLIGAGSFKVLSSHHIIKYSEIPYNPAVVKYRIGASGLQGAPQEQNAKVELNGTILFWKTIQKELSVDF